MHESRIGEFQARLKLVGELLESSESSQGSEVIRAREAKMLLRKTLEQIEVETEREFTDLESFLRACVALRDEPVGRLPAATVRDLHDHDRDFDPWFEAYDDPRRRMIGVEEHLTGDRFVMGLGALKMAEGVWLELRNRYFQMPQGRADLAEALTAGTLELPASDP
jgi:hypothetical protein